MYVCGLFVAMYVCILHVLEKYQKQQFVIWTKNVPLNIGLLHIHLVGGFRN